MTAQPVVPAPSPIASTRPAAAAPGGPRPTRSAAHRLAGMPELVIAPRQPLDREWAAREAKRLCARLATDAVVAAALEPAPRSRQALPMIAVVTHQMVQGPLSAGRLDDEGLYAVFLAGVAIFVIDDHFDEALDPATPIDQVAALADGLARIAGGGRASAGDAAAGGPAAGHLFRYLMVLQERLERMPGFALHRAAYARALAEFTSAMVEEFAWRQGAPASLERYLGASSRSIGSSLPLLTGLSAIALPGATPDETGAQAGSRMEGLQLALEITGTVLRLANDLRSYERELAEGNVSAVVLAARRFGLAGELGQRIVPGELLQLVRALLVGELGDLNECLRIVADPDGHFDGMVRALVATVLGLYTKGDFHDQPVTAAEVG